MPKAKKIIHRKTIKKHGRNTKRRGGGPKSDDQNERRMERKREEELDQLKRT